MSAPRLLRDILLTALAPLIWGSTYLTTTEFLPPDRPFTAAVLRCLPAGLLLLLWTRRCPPRGMWMKVAALAFLNIGFFQAVLFVSAYRLAGGLAAVLTSTQVLMVLVLVAWIGREKVAGGTWLAAAAGVLGVAMLVFSPQAEADALGITAALAGAVSMAAGIFFARRWQTGLPVLALTGWQLFLGGLMLLPVALAAETLPEHLTAAHIGGYLYLCLIGAVLAYVLYFRGIGRIGPAAVSSLGLLSPVCAFVLGWLFAGQTMDAVSLAGFVLVLLSVAGVQYAANRCAA